MLKSHIAFTVYRHYVTVSFSIFQGPQGLRGYPGMVGRKGETVSHIPPTTAAKMKNCVHDALQSILHTKHTAVHPLTEKAPYRSRFICDRVFHVISDENKTLLKINWWK